MSSELQTPGLTRPCLSADEVAARIVADGVAPHCAAGCTVRRDGWTTEVGGSVELYFDLASLTKPMTAVAIARSGIDPRTPLVELLPEVRGTASAGVPLELFLAHRAGLDGHRAFFDPAFADGRGAAVDAKTALTIAACARRPDTPGSPPPAGFSPLYSDLGYLLAGAALARGLGVRDAGDAIARLVLWPLGIADEAGTVRGLAERGIDGPFAPTEDVPWRGGRVVGAVHDENAWALTGEGGSGHAGIFGRASAVLTFGAAVLDGLERRGPLGNTSLDWLVRPRSGGTLRAGFDGKSVEGSSAGAAMSPNGFGHLGFVGTSLWLDPDALAVVTLLTHRVYKGRSPHAIRAARPWAHDALWARARYIAPDHERTIPGSERHQYGIDRDGG